MMMSRLLRLWLLVCLGFALWTTAEGESHLVIAPQSPTLEIGTNFTATCMIINTAEATAEDLYWEMSRTTVPKEQYTQINSSASSVTVSVTGEEQQWLFCHCKNKTPYFKLNQGKFIHGILLTKGYRPEKPENLTCMAVQDKTRISPTISCWWYPVGRQTIDVPTEYTLYVTVVSLTTLNVSAPDNHSGKVTLDAFPTHMTLEIWVEAQNRLGRVESEHLREDAGYFVKTNPPMGVKVISEKTFPTSLLINMTNPLDKSYMSLKYQIRFCAVGSQIWTYVPLVDTAKDIQSFRLQSLRPDTLYVTQVRCRNSRDGHGYWSEWSDNATEKTPADRPTSKPDLWKKVVAEDTNTRHVQIISKDPVFANGRIIRFDLKIQEPKDKVRNVSQQWESISVEQPEGSASSQRLFSVLKEIQLANEKSVEVYATAINSVGNSPKALLIIPEKAREFAPVKDLKAWPHQGQLWLEWSAPNSTAVSEYVVEWMDLDGRLDWQRESRTTRNTSIKGKLKRFVLYRVSVYTIYSGWIGKAATIETYLEQGAPLEGPAVRLKGKPQRNKAELEWDAIPHHRRRGFITNYTVFYTNGTELHSVTVPSNMTSVTLESLSGNTKYDTWIKASTIQGSELGFNHSFTTLKYAPGEIEGVVVGVSLGFLFVFIITMLLCLYKKDVIKKNFWPHIPNPGESTIGSWSPDYSLKAETARENCLSGISVMDLEDGDGKCVFDEDKTGLPLKKDKYLSEDHSSGIGGSSCMSSPRQSVSDSDEGGDMADTTASTVQYSSVVASTGYKGQTPSSQPQQPIFSRSESTQPLLDCEENPEGLQEGSRQNQHFPRRPRVSQAAGNEDGVDPAALNPPNMLEPLDFCPLEEETTLIDGRSAESQPDAGSSSYMPQLGGYRPQ